MQKLTPIQKFEQSFLPLIAVGAVLGMLTATMGGLTGSTAVVEFFKNSTISHMVLLALWPFFTELGTHVSIPDVKKAGRVVGIATIGGVIGPWLLTSTLCYAVSGQLLMSVLVGTASTATDVGFSVSTMNMLKKTLQGILTSVMLLGIIDDIVGIGLAGALFGENIQGSWLLVSGMILLYCLQIGPWGSDQINRKEIDPKTGEVIREVVFTENRINVHTPKWVGLAIANTIAMSMAHVEPILGGCLVMILAPSEVKHAVAAKLSPITPIILLVFGFYSCGVDLSSPGVIFGNPYFWVALIGGFCGKFLFITGGAFYGRHLERKQDNPSIYAKMKNSHIFSMATAAAACGTVAIFFVQKLLQKGIIELPMAQALTVGYIGTVVLAFIGQGLIMRRVLDGAEDFVPAGVEPEPAH